MLFTVGLLSLGFGKGPHVAFTCYVSLVSHNLLVSPPCRSTPLSPQALTRWEDGPGVLQNGVLHAGFPAGCLTLLTSSPIPCFSYKRKAKSKGSVKFGLKHFGKSIWPGCSAFTMHNVGGTMSYPLSGFRRRRLCPCFVKMHLPLYDQQIVHGLIRSAINYQRRRPPLWLAGA